MQTFSTLIVAREHLAEETEHGAPPAPAGEALIISTFSQTIKLACVVLVQ